MSRKPGDRYANAELVSAAFTEALQQSPAMFTGPLPAMIAQPSASMKIPTLPTLGGSGDGRATTTSMHGVTLDSPPPGKTIAVLPFGNQGPPEDSYLADGLSDDLIDSLSILPGLRVCSRGAVAVHAKLPDPQARGRALGVDMLVEGTVRRLGERLRITARLVQVSDGFQVWAQRFDRPAADALQVSDEVAQAVASALTGEVSPPQRMVLNDAQAVDLYLRARALLQRGDPPSLRASAPLLEQALALRPQDPMLLTAYAQVKARLWFFGGEGSGDVARAVAEQAVAAAPELGESHLALATMHFHSGDAARAVRELKLALKLAPNLAAAHDLLGRILVESGPHELGLRHIDRALELEPWMAKTQVDRARVQALLGNWEAADQLLAELWQASPPSIGMWVLRTRLAVWRRDNERNEAYLRSPELALPQFSLPREILEVALGKRRPEPRRMFGIAGGVGTTSSSPRGRSFYHQMEVELYLLSGDTDSAIRSLARAVDIGLFDRMWLDGCPLLAALRSDLRFHALRKIVVDRTTEIRTALR